jgi:hypothetical protein
MIIPWTVSEDLVLKIAAMASNQTRCRMLLVCRRWNSALMSLQAHEAWLPGKQHALAELCLTGSAEALAALPRIHALFGLVKSDIVHDKPRADSSLFITVVETGRVDLLRYIHHTWPLTRRDVSFCDNLAICIAAENGHLDMLKFLADTWHLTADDARGETNYGLRKAAENGHVEVLRFMAQVWRMDADDARTYYNFALRKAAENGHVKVLDFMAKAWNLTLRNTHLGVQIGRVGGWEYLQNREVRAKWLLQN